MVLGELLTPAYEAGQDVVMQRRAVGPSCSYYIGQCSVQVEVGHSRYHLRTKHSSKN